jgi:O-antigen ligase/tetratricopeptide (TPR) repeat protein
VPTKALVPDARPLTLGENLRPRLVRLILGAMEAVVLLLVVLSPWAFGGVHPISQFFLLGGVGVLLALWALRILVEWRVTAARCPTLLCLVGLFLLGVLQIAPLPQTTLEFLSPGTVALTRELLPTTPEQVAAGEPAGAAQAGRVISLDPGATRSFLVGLLAIIALFAVVRNNLASPDCLRRLAVVALANGALLALFGLVQFFSSPNQSVYWHLPTRGNVFGPFINRNHFACYANTCIGLGLGVLLSLRHAAGAGSDRAARRDLLGELPLFLSPRVLAVALVLALMIAATVVCLSRGGMVSLLAAGVACALLSLWRTRQPPRVWGGLLVAAAAAALVAWLSFQAVEARVGTLWRGEALEDARLKVWARVLPLWLEFPVWGTGFGTFVHVEPLSRAPGHARTIHYDHADNDYLQLLIEGGGVGLALALIGIAFLYRGGCRNYLRQRNARAASLSLGALFAVTAVVVHSFFDYGLHIPAIALLAATVAALATGARKAAPDAAPAPQAEAALTLGGLAPVVGAVGAVVLGLVLVQEGWCAAAAERYRLAAELCKPSDDVAVQARRRQYLRDAVALAPDDARLRLELAEAYHDAFEASEARHTRRARARQASAAVGGGHSLGALAPTPLAALTWGAALAQTDAAVQQSERRAREQDWAEYLQPSLECQVRARDLCPLLGQPHVRLATYAGRLAQSDGRAAYLRRAARLLPHDERIWFVCGARALDEGEPEEAWRCWRRSLECSPRYLVPIVTQGSQNLTPAELVAKVVPADPLLLYQAARTLDERAEAGAARRALLQAAIDQFAQHAPTTPDGLHARAHSYQQLGQTQQAIRAYRDLVEQAPENSAWRFEYAQLLHQSGRLSEARRELADLLRQDPGHSAARSLHRTLVEQLTEGD